MEMVELICHDSRRHPQSWVEGGGGASAICAPARANNVVCSRCLLVSHHLFHPPQSPLPHFGFHQHEKGRCGHSVRSARMFERAKCVVRSRSHRNAITFLLHLLHRHHPHVAAPSPTPRLLQPVSTHRLQEQQHLRRTMVHMEVGPPHQTKGSTGVASPRSRRALQRCVSCVPVHHSSRHYRAPCLHSMCPRYA